MGWRADLLVASATKVRTKAPNRSFANCSMKRCCADLDAGNTNGLVPLGSKRLFERSEAAGAVRELSGRPVLPGLWVVTMTERQGPQLLAEADRRYPPPERRSSCPCPTLVFDAEVDRKPTAYLFWAAVDRRQTSLKIDQKESR
ncbi:DUF1403 family protein [Sinorhizobium medicae]|nr:DUF1403 family protein [Sinorhizobium medicae]MDX1238368.1 DUF1403 family protein [Sinorhizobium medicae]